MIFLPIPDGNTAEIITFYDGFTTDYKLYIYRRSFPNPDTAIVERVFSAIDELRLLPYDDSGHYVIDQTNAAWVGEGINEFRKQIFNPQKRYASVGETYELDIYKNECAIFIGMLNTGDFIVINADPRADGDGFRNFDIRLILDGLPLNENYLEEFLERTGLTFGGGKPWDYDYQMLKGPAVSGIEVNIIDYISDDYGYVEKVVCENPLYQKRDFLTRFFPKLNNILSNQKYIVASCSATKSKPDVCSISSLKFSDLSQIGRHITQNVSVTVSMDG